MSLHNNDPEEFDSADDREGRDPEVSDPEQDPELAKNAPRSVFNLVYDSEDDDDLSKHSSRSYLEEDDLPLPEIHDSDESRCTACGECCDCCEVCLRKRKNLPKCKCGWVRNVIYYLTLNLTLISFFWFDMYMSQVNYSQNPEVPPFRQLLFKPDQYPGLTLVPSMMNIQIAAQPLLWYVKNGNNNSNENRRPSTYAKFIEKLLYAQNRTCQTAKKCMIELDSLGPCQKYDYGYAGVRPCIYLKLNRLTLWEPKEYLDKASIPEDFPDELRNIVDVKQARIWVNCKGATLYDKDIIGEIKYYPGPFYYSYYFPIDGELKNNPIIAIQLENLKTGYMAQLVCGMYAKNLHKHSAFRTFIYVAFR